MDTTQSRKILKRIQTIESDLESLRAVRAKLGTSEYASATMSSGGGSKSYTRADVGKITTLITELETELRQLRKLLATDGRGSGLYTTINYVYC